MKTIKKANWMANRENILQCLEHCEFHLSEACLGCPYSQYDSHCLEVVKADVIALLKESEEGFLKCPNCGKELDYLEKTILEYCPGCGRKIE